MIQLTMTINFVSSKDDSDELKKKCIQKKIMQIFLWLVKHEIIEEHFESLTKPPKRFRRINERKLFYY